LKTRSASQLSRMNCQMFPTGFNSGEQGGMRTNSKVQVNVINWHFVEVRPRKGRKVQDGTLPDAEDALFTAAMIERDKGGPLETIYPPLGVWQQSGQQFPMPAVTDPPPEVRRVLTSFGAPASGAGSLATTMRRKVPEAPGKPR
jgi:hypothetical protein